MSELIKSFELNISKGLVQVRRQGDNYDVVKWHNEAKTVCHSIATFRFNKKEPCWYMETVGTRLWLDDYEEQENVWIVLEEATKVLDRINY
jgi:hypothetical protein